MILAVPVVAPVTIPVLRPTVATVDALLVQVPPPASLSAVVVPTQTIVLPDIEDGVETIVIVTVAMQPVGVV